MKKYGMKILRNRKIIHNGKILFYIALGEKNKKYYLITKDNYMKQNYIADTSKIDYYSIYLTKFDKALKMYKDLIEHFMEQKSYAKDYYKSIKK